MPAHHHRFESQNTTQTLSEGLAEYFEAHPGLKRDDQLVSKEAREFFRAHDTVHVVYGCGTSMTDEAIVKLASLFGTTGGFQVLRGYTHHETLDIYRRLPLWETLLAIAASPYLLARTLWRCTRQTQRWPWGDHAQFLHTPLPQLRARYGIRVAHGRTDAPGSVRPNPP